MEKLEFELALQNGMKAEIKNDRVIITIDTKITKRDLWKAQMQFWLTDNEILDSGFFRLKSNNKISFHKS